MQLTVAASAQASGRGEGAHRLVGAGWLASLGVGLFVGSMAPAGRGWLHLGCVHADRLVGPRRSERGLRGPKSPLRTYQPTIERYVGARRSPSSARSGSPSRPSRPDSALCRPGGTVSQVSCGPTTPKACGVSSEACPGPSCREHPGRSRWSSPLLQSAVSGSGGAVKVGPRLLAARHRSIARSGRLPAASIDTRVRERWLSRLRPAVVSIPEPR